MEEMHSGVHLHSRVTLTFIPTRGVWSFFEPLTQPCPPGCRLGFQAQNGAEGAQGRNLASVGALCTPHRSQVGLQAWLNPKVQIAKANG